MKRYALLYLVTLLVLLPLDFLFLGVIAKPFFKTEVGDMLGDPNVLPAVIFYPLYALGVLIFVTGAPNTSLSSSVIYGAAGEVQTFVSTGGTESRTYNENGQMKLLSLPSNAEMRSRDWRVTSTDESLPAR